MATSHDPQPTPEQQWLLQAIRNAERQVQAPDHLRAWVHARAGAPRRARPARIRLGLAGMAATAAAAVAAVALVLTIGGAAAPTVARAVALAARGADRPPPPPDPRDPARRLSASVDDIYFPNGSGALGWRAVGQRVDRLDGHQATTVYYRSGAQSVAYTIVSAPALAQPNAPVKDVGGLRLRTLAAHGRVTVTWRRDGKTCILSATGATSAQLRRLASWTQTTAT